jgi:hypothetical protein
MVGNALRRLSSTFLQWRRNVVEQQCFLDPRRRLLLLQRHGRLREGGVATDAGGDEMTDTAALIFAKGV